MARKWTITAAAVFILYAGLLAVYFTQEDLFAIPAELHGTAADPYTFMEPGEVERAETLARIRGFAYFLNIPVTLVVLGAMIWLSVRVRRRLERTIPSRWGRLIVFAAMFVGIYAVLMLPVRIFYFVLNHVYGLSNLSVGMWLSDQLKTYAIDVVMYAAGLALFLWVVKRSPRRWWLWFWAMSVPLILFLRLINPIVIDPLFNDYTPLRNEELKQDILAMAERANIPAEDVFEVNISERTNTVNAYVTGIGGSARIVLWDTTLQKLEKDEILVIMAHEMGHYVHRDVWRGTLAGIAGSLLMFGAGYVVLGRLLGRFGERWGVRGADDLAALPVLLLILYVLTLAGAPVENAISRHAEHRADVYAMEATRDGDAAIRSFQKLTEYNRSVVKRPLLLKLFLGSHPSTMERIEYFERYR